MNKNALINAFKRTDATAGLIEYVNTIKPYHTKIMEVLAEYVFTEPVDVTILETLCWDITMDSNRLCDSVDSESNPTIVPCDNTIITPCNWGVIWSPTPPSFTLQIYEAGIDPASIPPSETDPTRNVNTLLIEEEALMPYPFIVNNVSQNKFQMTGPIPEWLPGFAVRVEANPGDTLPSPLNSSEIYYIVTDVPFGHFKLSKRRIPLSNADIINITDAGSTSSTFIIRKAEYFYPGAEIVISGSTDGLNDGIYTVYRAWKEGSRVRVALMQPIAQPTYRNVPVPITDGVVSYNAFGGWSAPQVCFPEKAPNLYTKGYIAEKLIMQFADDPNNPIILTQSMMGGISQPLIPLPVVPVPPGYDVTPFDNV